MVSACRSWVSTRDDYEYLVKEDRGRRLSPAVPERSLLLKKATNQFAHGGGQRLSPGSIEYLLLAGWIGQGTPFGSSEDAVIERIEVSPRVRLLDRNSSQQLSVMAFYSDGTTKDVTMLSQFEPNSVEMIEATPSGLVKTLGLNGEAAVMIRFLGQVDVFRATIPLGVKVESTPAPRNFVDEIVFGKLKTLGMPPSAVCDDATFVRRAALDIAGRLPTADEAEAFLADQDSAKRDKWIDRLLASPEYADFFAAKWNSVFRNRRTNERHTRGNFVFHEWLRESLQENKPYDRFVRELLTATGDMMQNPPVAWYRAVPTSNEQLEDTAQLFLGMRIQCARCHHHPYEKWSQQDYFGLAAFFSQVSRKNGIEYKQDEGRIYHKRGAARAVNPRNGVSLLPTGLDGEPLTISPDVDPRGALVDWMVDPKNPFFARALANRYWKHFFGRGIVDPEDDMRVTNPATNPELLDALAQSFLDSHFDLKQLVRTICRSHAYQLSAEPNRYNAADKQNFSRYYPKRLSAEVLYDALNQATGTSSSFTSLPSGTRAVQLPDNGFDNYFLTVFGKPQNRERLRVRAVGRSDPRPDLAHAQLEGGAVEAERKDRPRGPIGRRYESRRRPEARRIVPGGLRPPAIGRRIEVQPRTPGSRRIQGRQTAGLGRHRLGAGQRQGIPVQPLGREQGGARREPAGRWLCGPPKPLAVWL